MRRRAFFFEIGKTGAPLAGKVLWNQLMSRLDGLFAAAARCAGRRLFVFALLLFACVLAYFPALNGEFVWDDLYLVSENPFFRSPAFSLEVFRHYLYLDSFSLYYRPVQNLSYMADYWLWNSNPLGYHLSNVLIHVASAFLLYLLLRRILPSLRHREDEEGEEAARSSSDSVIACLVSFVWAIHPIHNAAVAYIAGRADSLATMFAVGGWLLYCNKAPGTARTVSYLVAPVLFLLAMASKELAFIWIALFGLYLFAFDRDRKAFSKAVIAGSLLAAFAGYVALRHLPAFRASQPSAFAEPPLARALLMLRALGDYASLIFFPDHLHMERIVSTPRAYENMERWQGMIRFEYLSLIGLLAAAGLVCAVWSKAPGRRLRVFGASWFALGFLPISNLFPLNAQVAEHWIYMASFGFFLVLAGAALAVPKQGRAALALLACLAAAGLGARTALRAREWADPETFFKQTIAEGTSSARAQSNLALVYTRRGDHAQAEKVLRAALQQFPHYATLRINLGTNLLVQGRASEAEPLLNFDKPAADHLANSYPHTWSAALNMAHIRYNEGATAAAVEVLDDAATRFPEIWEIVQFKAQILNETDSAASALPGVERYARAHWWHYKSHVFLGKLRGTAGDLAGAAAALEEAGRLDIHAAEPYQTLARMEMARSRFGEAVEAQLKALRRDAAQPTQYLFLANIYEQMNRKDDAAAAVQKAQRLFESVQAQTRYL